jgi:hypothetical protein
VRKIESQNLHRVASALLFHRELGYLPDCVCSYLTDTFTVRLRTQLGTGVTFVVSLCSCRDDVNVLRECSGGTSLQQLCLELCKTQPPIES